MANQFKHRWRSDQLAVLGLLFLLFLVFTVYLNWILGLAGFVLLTLSIVWFLRNEAQFDKELKAYIAKLSYRLKKVGDEALLNMPIGIVLYDEAGQIEWVNPYMNGLAGGMESLVGKQLNEISDKLMPLIDSDAGMRVIKMDKRYYSVTLKRTERLLYFTDVTDLIEIKRRYYNEQAVFAIIYLDNYDEVTQGMEDQVRSTLNNVTTSIIKGWAANHGIYLRRTSSDRFFAVLNEKVLKEAEADHFKILDKVREKTSPISHIPLTLSIGIGAGATSLTKLGEHAQLALDLALGRGGDQVAVKQLDGKVKFYGGKSNPVEKRTRVRARVISHALSELILESDQVLVMGHKSPDMDSIGACIGIMKIAAANGRYTGTVIDLLHSGSGITRLLSELKQKQELWDKFISIDDAVEVVTKRTLIVVVDTHRPSMVIEPRLLERTDRVVVIDHHRRAEEFIKDPVLVYMEPYASSTAELVTELLEYQPKELKLDVIEATAMLAGIAVDTKNFTLQTGSRTFDAASYLRAHGADTILVQKLLSDDLRQFNLRADLIRKTQLYKENIAIATGSNEKRYDQVLIAQTADTLLRMEGVKAAFVICIRDDGKVSISARSLGAINVQLIMEDIGGGGHLTNAATQMENETVEGATERLKQAIDRYLEGGMS